jgi:hypothetical protein
MAVTVPQRGAPAAAASHVLWRAVSVASSQAAAVITPAIIAHVCMRLLLLLLLCLPVLRWAAESQPHSPVLCWLLLLLLAVCGAELLLWLLLSLQVVRQLLHMLLSLLLLLILLLLLLLLLSCALLLALLLPLCPSGAPADSSSRLGAAQCA